MIENKKRIFIFLSPNIDIAELQDMADWFQYLEIANKSKATQKDVDLLVKQIKLNRWAKSKGAVAK